MKKLTALGVLAAAITTLALASLPASAAAGMGIRDLARAECRDERATDTREFENRYGGLGKAAMMRCIRSERRQGFRECRRERRHDTAEFVADYGGTDRRALRRCVRDELR